MCHIFLSAVWNKFVQSTKRYQMGFPMKHRLAFPFLLLSPTCIGASNWHVSNICKCDVHLNWWLLFSFAAFFWDFDSSMELSTSSWVSFSLFFFCFFVEDSPLLRRRHLALSVSEQGASVSQPHLLPPSARASTLAQGSDVHSPVSCHPCFPQLSQTTLMLLCGSLTRNDARRQRDEHIFNSVYSLAGIQSWVIAALKGSKILANWMLLLINVAEPLERFFF